MFSLVNKILLMLENFFEKGFVGWASVCFSYFL
jgi:hypothetical protein